MYEEHVSIDALSRYGQTYVVNKDVRNLPNMKSLLPHLLGLRLISTTWPTDKDRSVVYLGYLGNSIMLASGDRMHFYSDTPEHLSQSLSLLQEGVNSYCAIMTPQRKEVRKNSRKYAIIQSEKLEIELINAAAERSSGTVKELEQFLRQIL